MNTWVICISGFRQTPALPTGMDRLFATLLQLPDVRAEYRPWDHDWFDYAAYLHRHATDGSTIILAAYSWGAGYGAVKLSEALRSYARGVRHAVLADPVYRRPWVPPWFSALPTSLMDGRVIHFPSSVREISWFYQRQDKPSGHRPVGAKVVNAGVELPFDHAGMEDSAEFRMAVLGAVRG